ncbi:MAG TPA: hypothetical protein VJT84_14210 [Gaiellaceae bacterium]|nr:hypothetical protein [Gaiellaceae bacterium]
MTGRRFRHRLALFLVLLGAMAAGPAVPTGAADGQSYSQYSSWSDLVDGARSADYPPLFRLSDPGTDANPSYTGFWWYAQEQFDPTGRYALAMRTHVENQPIRPTDVAEVGYYDLKYDKWKKIGETNAWNYQQGSRLQWRPNSDEILWNDRSDDKDQYVTRVFDVSRGRIVRTLPRPIYIVSPDGRYALTHDFDRAKKPDIRYCDSAYPEDCIPDQDCPADEAAENAPDCTGVFKMDLDTGRSELILSLARIADEADPDKLDQSAKLYIMRESWNASGSRIAVMIKGGVNQQWTMAPDGTDLRTVYDGPSHPAWLDDGLMLDGHGFGLYKDVNGKTGSGVLFPDGPPNAHVSGIGNPGFGSALQNDDWVLADTYSIPLQYLFLYHRPTKTFIPLARLHSTAQSGLYRIDLQARTSRDGRTVTIDSSYEGVGRQLYELDIGYILDSPPSG